MRFSVFWTWTSKSKHASINPCQSVLQRLPLDIEHNGLIIIAMAYHLIHRKKLKKRKHSWWVHNILKTQEEQGEYEGVLNGVYRHHGHWDRPADCL